MLYEEFAPAGVASTYVESYWRFSPVEQSVAQIEHKIVPDGLVSISAALSGEQVVAILLIGPTNEAHVVPIQRGVRYAGLRLRPGATKALLDINPADIARLIVPMADVCGPYVVWARAALASAFASDALERLDASIASLATRASPIDPIAAAASARLLASNGLCSVAVLASDSGLSERHFRTRFTAAAGLSPKIFARIRRQRAAWMSVAIGEAASLAEASQVAGYADQPHFSRETQRAFSATPATVSRYIGTISHEFR